MKRTRPQKTQRGRLCNLTVSRTDRDTEQFSVSRLFHDVEAYYISIGMTYDQFWRDDVWLARSTGTRKNYAPAEPMLKRGEMVSTRHLRFPLRLAICSARKGLAQSNTWIDRFLSRKKEQDEYEYQRALEAQERIKRAMFSMMNQKDGGSNG